MKPVPMKVAPEKPAVEVRNVSFSYGSTPTISELNFTLGVGEILLVVGPNGAGKSTLLKLLNGILRPESGEIVIQGKPSRARQTADIARSLAVTFQDPSDQLFAKSTYKELEYSLVNSYGDSELSSIDKTLSMLNLIPYSHKHPYDCPFAVRKLISIASAIVSRAPILAFDEPTAGLSESEHAPFVAALDSLRKAGRSFVIVSHDLRTFLPLAASALVLRDGKARYHGSIRDLLTDDRTLRAAGLRLPQSLRLKRYVRLPLITQEDQRDNS